MCPIAATSFNTPTTKLILPISITRDGIGGIPFTYVTINVQ